MPALGLDVPKKVIDDLFSEWDQDGGGEIGYQELRKILQAPRGASPTGDGVKNMKKIAKMALAASAMAKAAKK